MIWIYSSLKNNSILYNKQFSFFGTYVLKSDYFLHNVCPFVGMNTSATAGQIVPKFYTGWGVGVIEEFRETQVLLK